MSAKSYKSTKRHFIFIRHAPSDIERGQIAGRWDVDALIPQDDRPCPAKRHIQNLARQDSQVISSGARRCMQTAAYLGLEIDSTIPALFEQDFGLWEGKTWLGLEQDLTQQDRLQAFWQSPATSRPPKGESFLDQCKRVSAVLDQLSCPERR